jgi:hypothetical protein
VGTLFPGLAVGTKNSAQNYINRNCLADALTNRRKGLLCEILRHGNAMICPVIGTERNVVSEPLLRRARDNFLALLNSRQCSLLEPKDGVSSIKSQGTRRLRSTDVACGKLIRLQIQNKETKQLLI